MKKKLSYLSVFCLFFFTLLSVLAPLELVFQTFTRGAAPTLPPPYEGALWQEAGTASNTLYYAYGVASASDWVDAKRVISGEEVFTDSGSFTVPSGVNSLEVLLIAGGGGGGNHEGGGGGAGGYIYSANYAVTPGSTIPVTVGGAGTGSAAPLESSATAGGDSVFGALTAIGGGRGGSSSSVAPTTGGSGGGGNGFNNLAGAAGTAGPPLQGYAGGTGYKATDYNGGGGGGAAAVGANANATLGGNGGAGTRIQWAAGDFSEYFSGGGGGGGYQATGTPQGGIGGGGNGGAGGGDNPGSPATYYGGGGGGGHYQASYQAGGDGYQGIVIVRWGN